MADATRPWNMKSLGENAAVRLEVDQARDGPRFNRRPFMRSLTPLPWTTGAVSSQGTLVDWIKIQLGQASSTSPDGDSASSAFNSATSSELMKQAPIVLQPELQKWTVCAVPLIGC